MKSITFEEEKYYHVYNRGNNRENIFIESQNYSYFLELVKKYLLPIAEIYSYCLLPNHFHFVLQIKEKKDLPKSFREGKIKLHQPFSNMLNTYVKAINKKYSRYGSLFQEHLKKVEIKDENYLRNLIIYVNTNASHHEIDDFEKYSHSSYPALISDKPTLLQQDKVINFFDDKQNFILVNRLKKIDLELINDLLFE